MGTLLDYLTFASCYFSVVNEVPGRQRFINVLLEVLVQGTGFTVRSISVIIPCSHINLNPSPNPNANPNQRFICHVLTLVD